ncbi:MAG: hypothetical protein Pars2KO_19580 [Parasphingorhabdus sp.]
MEERDFSAVQKDGFDLVGKARELGVSSTFLISDLSSAMFPKSDIILSDRLLSNSKLYLRSLVKEIESQLCLKATENLKITHNSLTEIGNSVSSYSFDHLCAAGLLNNDGLMRHVFVQAQKTELAYRLLQKISQEELENSLAMHIDDENQSVADAAMALLVSRNRSGFYTRQMPCRLVDVPVETYHQLVWSVTAAISKISGYQQAPLLNAAEILLEEHDESESVERRAQRLAGLLDHSEENVEIPHPIKDGLDLFFARVALRSGLNVNQLVIFTSEPNMARLVVVMKALSLSDKQAISIFTAINGSGNLLTPASYNEISQEQAKNMTRKWSHEPAFRVAERALSSITLGSDD